MKMKTITSGHDGFNSYNAGINDLAIDHARRVFVMGHGLPVDADGKPMAIAKAVELFRLNADEAATAAASYKTIEEG